MSAVAFDSLEYAQQLEAVGMSREQAEVVAKGVSRMFIHNFDSLVTKDYLESREAGPADGGHLHSPGSKRAGLIFVTAVGFSTGLRFLVDCPMVLGAFPRRFFGWF